MLVVVVGLIFLLDYILVLMPVANKLQLDSKATVHILMLIPPKVCRLPILLQHPVLAQLLGLAFSGLFSSPKLLLGSETSSGIWAPAPTAILSGCHCPKRRKWGKRGNADAPSCPPDWRGKFRLLMFAGVKHPKSSVFVCVRTALLPQCRQCSAHVEQCSFLPKRNGIRAFSLSPAVQPPLMPARQPSQTCPVVHAPPQGPGTPCLCSAEEGTDQRFCSAHAPE